MDTLALLCNLHADGPETLQLLRRAGWDTLAELEGVDAAALANALAISAERATRFQREAHHLRARLEGPGGDAAASAAASRTAARERSAPSPALPAARRGEPLEHEALEPELELPARDVLIPHPSAAPAPPAPLARLAKPPRPDPVPRRALLAPHAIDGLDATACEALANAGITSLVELAQALPLELASASGIEYTRLLRLQFLARRRASPAASQTPSFPAEAGEAEDVAGPFV